MILSQVFALFIIVFATWNVVAGVPSGSSRNAIGISLVGVIPSSFPSFRFPQLAQRDFIDIVTVCNPTFAVSVIFIHELIVSVVCCGRDASGIR